MPPAAAAAHFNKNKVLKKIIAEYVHRKLHCSVKICVKYTDCVDLSEKIFAGV